jgi:hypothetical protein
MADLDGFIILMNKTVVKFLFCSGAPRRTNLIVILFYVSEIVDDFTEKQGKQ